MSTRISDYDFDLPPELIAPRPLASRDASRMMMIDRAKGTIEHRMFRDFPEYLRKDDLVVLNNSRVIKARLRTDDRRIEILLLEPREGNCWKCLVKPGRKMRVGAKVAIAGVEAAVRHVFPEGERLVEFSDQPDLERYGAMPIPPYFNREADAEDDTRYQTVFAEAQGSVAAPTAGLHFTPEILSNIPHAFITLHVGIGTFQPVKAEIVEEHRMHEERYEISREAAGRINAASRLVAVGTTATRVLESQPPGAIVPHAGSTDIFIHPPMSLNRVGALLTNFHLPRSTLLMLVSAFAGKDLVFAAYEEAVGKSYRFFSYGDCMFVT